jgi:hypothetical protein
MPRRRAAAVLGAALVLPGVAGAVALASDAGGTDPSRPGAASATAPTTARPVTPPTASSRPVTTSATPATTSPTTTSTTAASSSTTTTTTMAPIVTHDARVGVGVLTPVAVSAPVRVVIPSIGATGPVAPTGVDAAGELAIPGDARQLVWWRFGPTPGAAGSAVIAGHLDWKGVLGVFDRLAETPVGERITVTYDDGHDEVFVVTAVALVDKPAVALDGTFARDGDPVLRLVTCGGEFDRATRHYRSNVIVTAVPA